MTGTLSLPTNQMMTGITCHGEDAGGLNTGPFVGNDPMWKSSNPAILQVNAPNYDGSGVPVTIVPLGSPGDVAFLTVTDPVTGSAEDVYEVDLVAPVAGPPVSIHIDPGTVVPK